MLEGTAGRARGFGARGRPRTQSQSQTGSQGSGDSPIKGNNGNGNGQGSALRERGGFYSQQLRTLPATVTQTSGEEKKVFPVMTNYFHLDCQYHVDFNPTVESPKMRRGMLMEHKHMFQNAFLFDGKSNVNALNKLSDDEIKVVCVRRTDNEAIQITIKFTGEIRWGHFEMLRLYNTQMRQNLKHLKFLLVGRHFFDPTQRLKIPEHKIEVWQGLLTAINEHDGGMLMVCDSLFNVVRTDTVYQILKEVYGRDRERFRDNARREIAGSIVMTTYNNRTYRVDDIVFDKNPKFVFERRHGSISIAESYREQYNLTIRDENQPLIQCLPDGRQKRAGIIEPILLVPELCVMTGLTESVENNFDEKKQMTTMNRADPMRRMANLTNFMNALRSNDDVRRDMQSCVLGFKQGVVELPARVLQGEKLLMRNDPESQGALFQQHTGDYGKEIRGKQMRNPANFGDWAIIVTERDRNTVGAFSNTLNRVCTPMGIQMNRPQVRILDNERTGTFVDTCKQVPQHLKIVVIIVPNSNKDRYDAIKKVLCCERPVASQVIVSRILSKKQMLMSVCTKIGIQMATMLGGIPWQIITPPKGLMVVGFDTYHDSTRKGNSVGKFVCSLNPTLSRWYSRTAYHENREEMSNNFANNLGHGLQRFHQVNGRLPEKVIIYRDGVSEGQIGHVYKTELKQIKQAIRNMDSNSNIQLVITIVTKRLSSRFFLKQCDRQVANPIPGTVVDTVMTRKERYNFYLVSQSVRQGTVSPTMYNIIEDNTNWKPNHHQILAYKLCHLYYNWMGTISVPAPCQYAHKLAYLTRTSLHREPSVQLADTLFFL